MAAEASGWRRCSQALLLAALLLGAGASSAHRGHAVWTDVTWVEDRFEIVHRMHLADAITANRHMGGRDAIEAPRSLARVALYVEERFLLPGASDGSGPMFQTIGAEIEDDFMFIYQEWVTALPKRFPVVDNTLLMDIEPGSQAFIHIEGPGLTEERERVD